jgi:CO/xanthine dehydrogenase Mo-binding subunit
MSKVAVISCGESAWLYPGPEGYDATIGCRDTVEQWLCDWWVFCDANVYTGVTPLGRPMIFAADAIAGLLAHEDRAAYKRFTEDVVLDHGAVELPPFKLPSGAKRWSAYSGLAGLGLAMHLKATHIDVYGADMSGTKDWRGRPGKSRNDQRWEYERAVWEVLVKAIESAGVTVRRVVKNG